MGWLSRTLRPADAAGGAAAPATGRAAEGAPGSGNEQAGGPVGRFGPLVSVTRLERAPQELEWQLPLNGELYRLMAGSDRPDYSLMVLERPLHFYPKEGFDVARVEPDQRVLDRRGRQMVRVHALLLCARFVGQQLHPGMHDLAVNLAYVIDNSLARDAMVDFGKIEFAAIGLLSEGVAPRSAPSAVADSPAEPSPLEPSNGDASPLASSPASPAPGAEAVGRRAREVLVRGIEDHRGRPVERLSALLTVDAEHRLVGLSGNADGEPPVPTPETFDLLNEVLAGLADDPAFADVRGIRVGPIADGGDDSIELLRD